MCEGNKCMNHFPNLIIPSIMFLIFTMFRAVNKFSFWNTFCILKWAR